MHRSLAIAVAAALTGCGPGHKDAPGCPKISGNFSATSTLADTAGACSNAKSVSVDSIAFKSGKYQSPVGGLASCHTRQAGCDVNVKCDSQVVNAAQFNFAGTLSPDGQRLTGTAVFSGSYQGCSKVVYNVDAQQQ